MHLLGSLDLRSANQPTVTVVALTFIRLAVCLATGPKPLPKRALHIVRSRASSFICKNPLLYLWSSSSCLRLIPLLPVTSIRPFIFQSITCRRRQFLRKMLPIQLAFRLLISLLPLHPKLKCLHVPVLSLICLRAKIFSPQASGVAWKSSVSFSMMLLTYLLTSWEANQSLQPVKKFPTFIWNPKVHYLTHKCPQLQNKYLSSKSALLCANTWTHHAHSCSET
jgi:hypothetical protein